MGDTGGPLVRSTGHFETFESKVTNKEFAFVVDSIPVNGPEPDEGQVAAALAHLPPERSNLNAAGRSGASKYRQGYTHGWSELATFNVDVPLVSWRYGLADFAIPDVPICTEACQPFHIAPPANTVWGELSENVFRSLDQQIMIHKYYIEYVSPFSAQSSREDFLLWVYRNTVPKHHATLPRLIFEFIDCIFREYEAIVATVTMPEFLNRNRPSIKLAQKQEMERRYLAAHA